MLVSVDLCGLHQLRLLVLAEAVAPRPSRAFEATSARRGRQVHFWKGSLKLLVVPCPYSKYPLFLGYFWANLVFKVNTAFFLVEGRHDTLKKVGIWSRGLVFLVCLASLAFPGFPSVVVLLFLASRVFGGVHGVPCRLFVSSSGSLGAFCFGFLLCWRSLFEINRQLVQPANKTPMAEGMGLNFLVVFHGQAKTGSFGEKPHWIECLFATCFGRVRPLESKRPTKNVAFSGHGTVYTHGRSEWVA